MLVRKKPMALLPQRLSLPRHGLPRSYQYHPHGTSDPLRDGTLPHGVMPQQARMSKRATRDRAFHTVLVGLGSASLCRHGVAAG